MKSFSGCLSPGSRRSKDIKNCCNAFSYLTYLIYNLELPSCVTHLRFHLIGGQQANFLPALEATWLEAFREPEGLPGDCMEWALSETPCLGASPDCPESSGAVPVADLSTTLRRRATPPGTPGQQVPAAGRQPRTPATSLEPGPSGEAKRSSAGACSYLSLAPPGKRRAKGEGEREANRSKTPPGWGKSLLGSCQNKEELDLRCDHGLPRGFPFQNPPAKGTLTKRHTHISLGKQEKQCTRHIHRIWMRRLTHPAQEPRPSR